MYVLNKDYDQARKFFTSIYPMTTRPDMSTYPLDIQLSLYPLNQTGEIHQSILSNEHWTEAKITEGMSKCWTHSWKKASLGGGSITTQFFRNIDSLNQNLLIEGGAGKRMTVRKFLLTLYSKEWKRYYFAAAAPLKRDSDTGENTVNVNFTVSVCRSNRQAQILRQAIQIIPTIPQLLLNQFGSDQLDQVLLGPMHSFSFSSDS